MLIFSHWNRIGASSLSCTFSSPPRAIPIRAIFTRGHLEPTPQPETALALFSLSALAPLRRRGRTAGSVHAGGHDGVGWRFRLFRQRVGAGRRWNHRAAESNLVGIPHPGRPQRNGRQGNRCAGQRAAGPVGRQYHAGIGLCDLGLRGRFPRRPASLAERASISRRSCSPDSPCAEAPPGL